MLVLLGKDATDCWLLHLLLFLEVQLLIALTTFFLLLFLLVPHSVLILILEVSCVPHRLHAVLPTGLGVHRPWGFP